MTAVECVCIGWIITFMIDDSLHSKLIYKSFTILIRMGRQAGVVGLVKVM